MMQSSTDSQKCLSTAQDASTSATAVSDQPHQQPQLLENSSKPHPKLLNCLMKPSLSLTSLPPQSPKETGDETQSLERPYNSLKVSRPLMFISQAITIFHFTYIFRIVDNIHVVRTLDFCYKFFNSLKFKTNLPFIHFRKSETSKKNFGVDHGNHKTRSAQQHRTRERAEAEMGTISGQHTTTLWTPI